MSAYSIKITVAISLLISFLIYTCILYSDHPDPAKAPSDLADEGKYLWQRHNCGACHQIYGLGGFLGPDLTNVYSTRGQNYIAAFVSGGTQVMPAIHLNRLEMSALMAYLKEVDASGNSDPRKFNIVANGTIRQAK